MTPEQIAAIRARAEAATPGPWVPEFSDIYLQKYGPEYCWESGYFVLRSPEGAVVDYWANQADDSGLLLERPDAEFIANARQDVPALLSEVDRLQAANDALLQGRILATERELKLKARLRELEAENERLRGALKAVEWEGEGGFWEEACCPECRAQRGANHDESCVIGSVCK